MKRITYAIFSGISYVST